MSKRTRENKKKNFLRKAQARERIGNYYLGYGTTAASGVEYLNYRAQRGWRLPKFINPRVQSVLNYLLGRPQMEPVAKEGGDA